MESSNKVDILIMGAGLTGLATATYLKKFGKDVLVIEAQNRIGGRIHTVGMDENCPVELGATWLGLKHRFLIELLNQLEIPLFKQEFGQKAIFEPLSTSPPYLASFPSSEESSYRIQGGTGKLINSLSDKIGKENIRLSEKVKSLHLKPNHVLVQTEKNSYSANQVISTLPPNLLINSIQFEPSLPKELIQIASSTHTWMGESIKVALSYSKPFWKKSDFSGTILSNVGPINEMYEHHNSENSFFALKGFMNGSYYSFTLEQRKDLILGQLRKYYGTIVDSYLNYYEKVWRDEKYTFSTYDSHIVPHQHNGHKIYQEAFFDGRLMIAGSETSSHHPGYMEGAISSAQYIYNKIMNDIA